jgi:general secretion pathway protein D
LATAACVCLLALTLGGCAAASAYRAGMALVERGDTQAGLAKLREAAVLEPRSTTYQLAYKSTLERLLVSTADEAERLMRLGQADEAERAWRRALAVDDRNERALKGLQRIDMQRRHERQLRQAEEAWARKDPVGARAALRPVLVEDPGHERARELSRRLEEARQRPAAPSALAAAQRKPVNVEFRDMPLRAVFDVIARASGLNFVFDKDVRTDQKTSLQLKNTTVEAAVQMVLLTNQLEQRVLDGNSILVYPNTPAKAKDYQPLSVRTFYLTNADAKAVAGTLKTLLKSRDIAVDEKLNLLIVRDTPEAVRLAEKVVALHDVADPEVMLEVEILEVKRSRLQELGVRLPQQLSLVPLPAAEGGTLTLGQLRDLDASRIGVTVSPISLQARAQSSDANILANPRIRARNREKAKILIGERVPNISTTATATGFVSESVAYVDVGLKLDVEPVVYPDNEVVIKVGLEVSNIINQQQTKTGTLAYHLGTRNASTVLRLKDGENQVLAGLINDEDRRAADGIPLLRDVPLIGRLFGVRSGDSTKTEIMLSITPKVLRNLPPRDAGELDFDSGTESNLGLRNPAVSEPGTPLPGRAEQPGLAGQVRQSGPGSQVDQAGTRQDGTASARAVSLAWQGPGRPRGGELVTLQLAVETEQPLLGLPVVVGFDPQALEFVGAVEGDFLRRGGARTSFASRLDADGQLAVQAMRHGDTGVAGAGVLAALTFRAVGAPEVESRVHLLSATPFGAAGQPVGFTPPQPHSVSMAP